MATAAFKRSGAIRTVRLGDMRVSPAAQREINLNFARHITDNFDPDKLGQLTVSERDGFYWIVDGQHRHRGAIDYLGEGWEEQRLEVYCYTGLDEEQEAELFLNLNNVRAVDAFDKFKVAVTAGRSVQTDIDRIVRSLGLKISRGQDDGSIAAVTALSKVYDRHTAKGLVQTLWTIREGLGLRGFDAVVIEGVGLFTARYEGRLDQERLVKKLAAFPGGLRGLISRARLTRQRLGQSIPHCIAAVITEVYNSGTRGTQGLGSWWKEGNAA